MSFASDLATSILYDETTFYNRFKHTIISLTMKTFCDIISL